MEIDERTRLDSIRRYKWVNIEKYKSLWVSILAAWFCIKYIGFEYKNDGELNLDNISRELIIEPLKLWKSIKKTRRNILDKNRYYMFC